MKKYLRLSLILLCLVISGCQNNKLKDCTMERIESSCKKAGYSFSRDEYNGRYDKGDEVLQVLIPVEDGSQETIYVISYDSEEQAVNVCNQINKSGSDSYVGNIGNVSGINLLVIYKKDKYYNIDDVAKGIISCNPQKCDEVKLKLIK